jgi:iron complex outermembrane receptor protein
VNNQFGIYLVTGAIVGLTVLPVRAESASGQAERETRETNISTSKEIQLPATTVQEWQAQIEATTVQVTGVQLQPSDTGLEIVLQTAEGKPLTVDLTKFRSEGNSLIADIPNAVLALPNAQEFNAQTPTPDIARVQVVQADTSTIRVTVAGIDGLPKREITLKTGDLTYSLKPNEEVEEIVVTGDRSGSPYFAPRTAIGTRTDTPILDTPQSIQVIPQEVLQDQQVIRFEESLRNVAGATQGGSNEGQGYFIGIRGFQGIPLLVDGFRQYGINGGESIVETANLERIEVLKGPAAVLFGDIQPGGAINLASKQPLSEPYYAAELQVGSRFLFRPQIDFSGPLTTDRQLLYRFIALGSTQESFRDFDTEFERFLLAPTLSWKINDCTDLTLQLQYLNNRQPADFGRIVAGDRVLRTPRNFITGEPGDYTETNSLNIGYNFEHRFNENWKLRNGFRYLSRGFEQEFAFAFLPDLVGGQLIRNFGGFDIDNENYSLQTNVVGQFATGPVKHTLLFGVDFNRTTEVGFGAFGFENFLFLDIANPVYGLSPRPNFRSLPAFFAARDTQNRLGVYLQEQVDLLDNLKLLVGARYDLVGQKTQNRETLFTPASEVSQTNEALSPRVGIVYQPAPALSLYASYSGSFAPNTGVDFAGQPFEPERGRGWEAGIKTELFDRKLLATLAYFDITKENVVTADPIRPFFSVATGEQRSRGIELDINGEILPGWNVIASYAYTDAEVTKDNTIPVGNRLNGIPEHSVSLWTTYQIQQGSLAGLGVGVGFNLVGERFGDLENSFKLDSYILVDAAIFYKRNDWRFAVNFKNIGNVDYDAGTPFGNTRIGLGEPFTAIGSISVQF